MSSPCCPWFRFGYEGEESELEFMYPQLPWEFGRGGEGGSDTAASGVQMAYNVRRDRIVYLTMRVHESELPAFEIMMDWLQDSATPFLFRFDKDVEASENSVYLESGRWENGPFRYPRDTQHNGVFLIPLALRTELGEPWAGASWEELATETV